MKILKKNRSALFLFCLCSASAPFEATLRDIPVPDSTSPEMRFLLDAPVFPLRNVHRGTINEWKTFVPTVANTGAVSLPGLREHMGMNVTSATMAAVPVFTITPSRLPPKNTDRILYLAALPR